MGDDYCAVCAENLEWTAYAQCGHTETCSKCVARLRFVLNDTRCVVCQQSDSAVVVTRYAGEYTNKLPASDFATLKVKCLACGQGAAAGRLHVVTFPELTRCTLQ
jgi:E3 ubiquitin-protein ligase ZNF598